MFRKAAVVALAVVCAALFGCATAPRTQPASTLRAFDSEEALEAHLKTMADELQSRRDEEERRRQEALRARAEAARKRAEEIARERAEKGLPPLAAVPAPPPPPKPLAKPKPAPAGGPRGLDSVTNVQHAGVDEGGIVKVHGNHLVILRRGRVFTVRIGDRDLTPVSAADAYGPDVNPRGAWYDEMLISGNTIVVVGYSYARGGTEIGLFDISAAGEIRYRATYHLRSNDYYSSRNYATRLIGSRLVFYTPLRLNVSNPSAAFPAVRRWRSDAPTADFKRIAPATRIYRTDDELDPAFIALHTVTICDLAKPELDCASSAVLGAPSRVFYVSARSVYVWTSARVPTAGQSAVRSGVFQIPLDGSAPSALKTAGTPIDQFSFLEGEDGYLNVLLRASGGGEGMWAAERNPGQLGLMRVALASFSDGTASAPPAAYRALSTPEAGPLQSRFIGDYVVYGTGAGWYRPVARTESSVYAIRYANPAAAEERLALPHGVDRIEALGTNALVIGSDGKDLHFTSVKLAARAEEAARYTRPNASQAETRSHGFYYYPRAESEGLVGLPVVGGGIGAARQLTGSAASVLYLRNNELKLSELGTLDAQAEAGRTNDACVASCVDWYGNSRPLFLRGRVFALMGYEIVEGSVSASRIDEVRRINFAPHWTQQVR